jgi:hypothetical protein
MFRRLFRKEIDSTLLANLARVGLLNERSRERLAAIGVRTSPSGSTPVSP